MSIELNEPYATANKIILRSIVRNRKLADQLIHQIYDLQLYTQAHGGTITQWVMPADIVPSTDTPYTISPLTIYSQLSAGFNSQYVAGRLVNVMRELEVIAGITPIVNSYVSYKKSPFKEVVLRDLIIAIFANRKFGALFQAAILELQVQMEALVAPTPAVAASFTGDNGGDLATSVTITADNAGVAGNVTVVADSVTDIDGLILAWNTLNPTNTLTLTAGVGTQVPTVDIVLAGGVDAIPFVLSQPRFV